MRVVLPAGLLALLPLVARGEVSVTAADGRVDLKAVAAPVSEVLDRLARQTGMKVTYDGPPVRQAVTLTLQGRTPAEAVLGVLDGLGLNYALRMDLGGVRVETLMIFGVSAPGSSAPFAPPSPSNTPVFRPAPPPEPEPEEETEPAEEPEPAHPAAKGGSARPQGPQGSPAGPPAPGTTGAPVPAPGLPTTGPMFPVSPFAPTAPTLPANPPPAPADGQAPPADDEPQ